MARLRINTLGELVRRTPDELLAQKNFGATSLNELRVVLAELDLNSYDGSANHPITNGVNEDSSSESGAVQRKHDVKWRQMFDELVKYKQQYGNCDIPMNWPTNPRLAGWVSSQRTAKKTGNLPANRFQLLDELGFIWQKNRGRPSLESNGDS